MTDPQSLHTTVSVYRSPEVVSALIGVIPSTTGILAVLTLLIVFRADIRRAIPRLTGVEAFGLKVSLINVERWAEQANHDRTVKVSDSDLKVALERAWTAAAAYQGVKILWADDIPEDNLFERRALTAFGADVTIVLSNVEFNDRIRRAEFDVVLSDLRRESGENPRDVTKAIANCLNPPAIIYYVRQREDVQPSESFGITTRPDELINLVTDALERRAARRRIE